MITAPDPTLTLFGLDIGHIERLSDRREEGSKRKLVNNVREVHHCGAAV